MEESTKTSEKNKMWKLKDLKVKNKVKPEVIKSGILGGQEDWQGVAEMIWSIARMELGETSGKISTAGRRETWWWNQEVQEKLKGKRKAKKIWVPSEMMQASWPIKLQKKQTKREVAKERNKAYEELYEKLETKKG